LKLSALGTSSFPVDRPLLAGLLGFDGVAMNSFDATQLAPADVRADAVYAGATGALTVGMLIADVTQQYGQTRPWIILEQGGQTGVSSIMPQKRNPTGLIRLRTLASKLHGQVSGFSFQAHNVPSGMHDYKLDEPDPVLSDAVQMFIDLKGVISALRFDSERALDEANADYSTTTELADILQHGADVPFRAGHHFASATTSRRPPLRVGHHFASELVTFGRAHRLRPMSARSCATLRKRQRRLLKRCLRR
jgi:argininosuccinate lyase